MKKTYEIKRMQLNLPLVNYEILEQLYGKRKVTHAINDIITSHISELNEIRKRFLEHIDDIKNKIES